MQPAVSTYSLARYRRENRKSVEQCLDWLADIGAGAVEFVGLGERDYKNPRQRARRLRQRCEQLGLRIVGYCTGGELLRQGDDLRTEVDRIKREIDVAAELGAPSMRHDVTRGPGENDNLDFAAVLDRIAPPIRELAEHGQQRGVVTTLENHGFYMQTAERVGKLIDTVDHPNFRLTIDLGNFLCLNQDPLDATQRLANRVVMAHAKDFHIKPKDQTPPDAPAVNSHPAVPAGWIRTPTDIALRGTITGHGALNLPAQLAALQHAGYDGPLSLEFEGPEDPLNAVRLGLAYLQQQPAAR
ncbi:MAG: sugar phosphate isomerase/epimerase family protein [Phycisphaeraceae bacterium]